MSDIDTLQSLFETIRDERNLHANTASRIGNAFLALLNFLGASPYLRKDQIDVTKYLLKLLGGASIGIDGADNATTGIDGKGITLGTKGNAEFDSVIVRGAIRFRELLINRRQVLEGDTEFSTRGIIDSVIHTDTKTYELTMRSEYDGYKISFEPNDICCCSQRDIEAGGLEQDSWFRVDSVDLANNKMDVTLYDDDDIPTGITDVAASVIPNNAAPYAGGVVVRRGNVTDKQRQSAIFLSSTDQRLLFTGGVTSPKLAFENIYLSLGKLPDFQYLRTYNAALDWNMPYLYVKGVLAQNFFKVDYKGNPVYEILDLGAWRNDYQYIKGPEVIDGKQTGKYYQHQAWHGGCVWRCVVALATIGAEPRRSNLDWTCVSGGENLFVDIVSSAGDAFPVGKPVHTTLTSSVYQSTQKLNSAELANAIYKWERLSVSGTGDAAWSAAGHNTSTLDITDADLPVDWFTAHRVGFRLTVTLADGTAAEPAQYNLSI